MFALTLLGEREPQRLAVAAIVEFERVIWDALVLEELLHLA